MLAPKRCRLSFLHAKHYGKSQHLNSPLFGHQETFPYKGISPTHHSRKPQCYVYAFPINLQTIDTYCEKYCENGDGTQESIVCSIHCNAEFATHTAKMPYTFSVNPQKNIFLKLAVTFAKGSVLWWFWVLWSIHLIVDFSMVSPLFCLLKIYL